MVRLMVDAPAAGSDESTVDAFLQGGRPAEHPAQGEPSLRHAPGPYFGNYGGRWMPESLIAALDELEDTFEKAKADPEFTAQIADLNKNYSGRPSLLTEAKRFAEHAGPSATAPALPARGCLFKRGAKAGRRQPLNVPRREPLGAPFIPVTTV